MQNNTEILFFKKLNEHKIKYLLIGRQACILYGLPLYTFDYDVAVDNSVGNLKKLLEIAKSLGLHPSVKEEKILNKEIPFFSLQNEIKIDVFCSKKYRTIDKKTIEFSEVFKRKKIKEDKKYRMTFYIPDIDDFIMFKKIKPRDKDFEDIKMLESIKKKK